ncbi:MAG: hypothetical protein H6811_09210 [Phycisphaeraceae bacterium]|nr:hypothetical protein [Phycisphaeraceae bacterium]
MLSLFTSPRPPTISTTPACRHCGYDLSGLHTAEGLGTCPECGHPFNPDDPAFVRPLPGRAAWLALLCWPTLLALASFKPLLLLAAWLGGAFAGGAFTILWLLAWLFCAVAYPTLMSRRIAAPHALTAPASEYSEHVTWAITLNVVGSLLALALVSL